MLRNILSLLLRRFYLSCSESLISHTSESFISHAQKFYLSYLRNFISHAQKYSISHAQSCCKMFPGSRSNHSCFRGRKETRKTKNLVFLYYCNGQGKVISSPLSNIHIHRSNLSQCLQHKKAASTQLPLLFKIHVMSKSLVSHLKFGWCSICVQDYIQ